MPHRFAHTFRGLLPPNPSGEIKEMYAFVLLRAFAVALVGIFEPIFLYQSLGLGLQEIVVYYLVVFFGFFVLVPFGGKSAARFGCERTIAMSLPVQVAYYVALMLTPGRPELLLAVMPLGALFRALLWPAHHANLARWMRRSEGGREVAGITALVGLTSMVAPVIGGAVISTVGYTWLFVAASVLTVGSSYPLLRTPERYRPSDFSVMAAYRRLTRKSSARFMAAHFGYGEAIIGLYLWPVFMIVAVPSAVAVGLIASLTKAADIVLALYVGGLTDDGRDRRATLVSGTLFTALSWLVRMFVSGGVGVFLVNTYHRLAQNMALVPFRAITYEQAQDGDVIASMVLREMGISIASMAVLMASLALVTFWPAGGWYGIFVLAALFSCFYALAGGGRRRRTSAEGPDAIPNDGL